MKAFIFAYDTNYNLGAAVIYAETKKEAIELAKTNNYIWDTNFIYEIVYPEVSKIINIDSDGRFADITNNNIE